MPEEWRSSKNGQRDSRNLNARDGSLDKGVLRGQRKERAHKADAERQGYDPRQ